MYEESLVKNMLRQVNELIASWNAQAVQAYQTRTWPNWKLMWDSYHNDPDVMKENPMPLPPMAWVIETREVGPDTRIPYPIPVQGNVPVCDAFLAPKEQTIPEGNVFWGPAIKWREWNMPELQGCLSATAATKIPVASIRTHPDTGKKYSFGYYGNGPTRLIAWFPVEE